VIDKSLHYSGVFLGVDLLVYFLIYFIFALTVNGFPVAEAARDGGGWVAIRLIYFQAIVQFALVAIVRFYGVQSNLAVIAAVCILAFLLPSVLFMKDISEFPSYFTVSIEQRQIGPGLALVISTSVAWLVVHRFTGLAKLLG